MFDSLFQPAPPWSFPSRSGRVQIGIPTLMPRMGHLSSPLLHYVLAWTCSQRPESPTWHPHSHLRCELTRPYCIWRSFPFFGTTVNIIVGMSFGLGLCCRPFDIWTNWSEGRAPTFAWAHSSRLTGHLTSIWRTSSSPPFLLASVIARRWSAFPVGRRVYRLTI